jgi:hypothetical protein
MGRRELRGRAVWQDQSGAKSTVAEKDFHGVFATAFQKTSFRIRSKPKEFSNIYTKVVLAPSVSAEIYNPKGGIKRHGIRPDYAIDNVDTKKTLYVEVKRQDGWVEGGKRSDGRGNAHERSCKYFTPGLLKVLRSKGRLGNKVLPFWTVFLGDITRDPCRVREITLWYKGHENHFFFWRNPKDEKPLLRHFQNRLKHLLT